LAPPTDPISRIMQALLEFAPLVAFFVAYYIAGLYVATAVLMGAMAVLLIVDYALQRRIPPMHGLSAVLVWLFGTATLVLHNQRFIQWKVTVFYWLAGAAFLVSFWVGKETLAQRSLGSLIPGTQFPQSLWRRLNALWVLFAVLMGGLNLLVAFNASEKAWVNFKVIGLTSLTFVFMAAQVFWLAREAERSQAAAESREAST
jgi:intracellular septation protein